MSFGSHPSNRPGESKICNFIGEVVAFFFEEDILAFDISVDEIFLMDALEPLHDFYYHFDSVFKRKNFAWQFCLVGKEISLLAVLHNNDDEVVG